MSMNMEKRIHTDQSLDRISNLPESLKRHILSYMPTRDAARASILSSSWRALWTDLPILDFGRFQLNDLLTERILRCNDDNASRMKRDSIVKKREEFYAFLDRTLGSISKLDKLNLYVPEYELELNSRLDHWLDCAVGCCVKTLNLEIGGKQDGARYSLPKRVLGVNSITNMKLQGCELVSASLANSQLPSLRKLSLQNVYLDEGFMGSLAVSFPNLEALTFKRCKGLTRVEVLGLTKLVKLDVEHHSEEPEAIVIDAPSLLEFVYVYEDAWDEFFQSAEIEFADCKNLKILKLVGSSLYDSELNTIVEGAPVLEQLFLYECHNLEEVFFSSKQLTLLEVERCRSLLTAQIDTPKLKTFHYADDYPITFRGKCSFKLTKASLYLKADIINDKWYARLIKFLSKLGNSEQLSLCVGTEEDLIVSQKVRMKSRPPLHGIKHLIVALRASFLKRTPVSFVEALLWLAPHPESITIYNEFIPIHKVLKFMYEKPLKGCKKCGCWKTPAIICWRHALEGVVLENQKGDEDDTRLANFFTKGRIDGKMVSFVKNVVPKKKFSMKK